jgi:4-hydroxy-2-oxoheptanedioate aldolase
MVLEAIDTIISKVRDSDKAVGIIASNPQEAKEYMDRGIQYVTISSDLGIIGNQAKAYVKALNLR